jgi:hypothetical protein
MKSALLAVALCLCAGSASAQIMEMNGTWKLNPARCLNSSLKEETLVYKIKAGEQGYVADWIDGDGTKGHSEWVAKYDGTDQPAGNGPGTTVSFKMSGKTEVVTQKRDGKVTAIFTRVLSDDGKSIMSIGEDANKKLLWVRVFEKQ